MTSKAKVPSARSIDIFDQKWAEAVRREPAIRLLAASENPVAPSLVVNRPGPRKGARKLPLEIADIIEPAIDTYYKRRERPPPQKRVGEMMIRLCHLGGPRQRG